MTDLRVIIALLQKGAEYDHKVGACCPICRRGRAPVYRTMPWRDNLRERYHRCRFCGWSFKSVESGPDLVKLLDKPPKSLTKKKKTR